jgi:hypothetical protein
MLLACAAAWSAIAVTAEIGAATPTAAAPITTTAAAIPIILPTEQATTAAQRDAFLGTYAPLSGCVSSASCCCATSPVTITAGSTAKDLQLAGSADGGAGCLGQSSLAGAFTMYDPMAAYTYLSFVPVLMQLQTENTHEWLRLNSTKSEHEEAPKLLSTRGFVRSSIDSDSCSDSCCAFASPLLQDNLRRCFPARAQSGCQCCDQHNFQPDFSKPQQRSSVCEQLPAHWNLISAIHIPAIYYCCHLQREPSSFNCEYWHCISNASAKH